MISLKIIKNNNFVKSHHWFWLCAYTYDGEDKEGGGDGGGAVEHDADVVRRQLHVFGRVGNQHGRQQETDGHAQLWNTHTHA